MCESGVFTHKMRYVPHSSPPTCCPTRNSGRPGSVKPTFAPAQGAGGTQRQLGGSGGLMQQAASCETAREPPAGL